MQCPSSSGHIAFAQPFGAGDHMKDDGRREYKAQHNMPVQQIEPGEVPLATSDPPDARSKRQRDKQQRQQPEDGAAIPAPGMDQPGPDAPQLAPQEQQQPEARYTMQREDEPILRAATHQADNAGRDGEAGCEREAPVGEARGKKSASLCSTVSFHLFMHSIPRDPRSTSNSPVPKYIITRTIVHFDKLIRPSVGADYAA